MKFTCKKPKKSVNVNFLDVTVSLIDQHLEIDLYREPSDCYQFLDFNSAHPIHVVKGGTLKDYVPPMYLSKIILKVLKAGFKIKDTLKHGLKIS